MEHFKSLYIDDELSLKEKQKFLLHIHNSPEYMNDMISLLRQEENLAATLKNHFLPKERSRRIRKQWQKGFGLSAAACLLCIASFVIGMKHPLPAGYFEPSAALQSATTEYRFVIYQEGTGQVEITGSFNNWRRIPLFQNGADGYWEVSLALPQGEHRYSFIINGSQIVPDPTVSALEMDDFGAVNSVITI